MDEITIDIKDCIRQILLKWRQICICMLLGALVLGAVGAMRAYQALQVETALNDADEAGESLEAESEFQAAKEALSDRETQEVAAAAQLYVSYYEELANTMEYVQNSAKMQLDPNCVPTLVLQYYIDTDYQVVYPIIDEKDMTEDIINSLIARADTAAIYERVAEGLEGEPAGSYVQELISFGSSKDLLTITILGLDEEYCETIAEVLKSVVEEEVEELQTLYGEFEITLTSESFSEEVNTSLLSSQQAQVTSMNNIRTAINNLTSGMTDDQKTYYYLLLDRTIMENVSEETETEEETEETAESESISVQWINLKYILLGLLAGAFLAIVWYGLRYILSPYLRVSEDMKDVYGVRVLGELAGTQNETASRNVIDRWILSLFRSGTDELSEEERLRMICAEVRITAEKASMKRIYLTGTGSAEQMESAARQLSEKLGGEIETVCIGKSVVLDPESLEALAASEGAVLVEQIGSSRYDDVKRECELCALNHVSVIGSVVLNG
ncbi:MAG: hypothetical protein LUF34_09100 [Lachnospiraceae bacterium]|nr:hypothetical protein [Lachnospiraceae bacterium]